MCVRCTRVYKTPRRFVKKLALSGRNHLRRGVESRREKQLLGKKNQIYINVLTSFRRTYIKRERCSIRTATAACKVYKYIRIIYIRVPCGDLRPPSQFGPWNAFCNNVHTLARCGGDARRTHILVVRV